MAGWVSGLNQQRKQYPPNCTLKNHLCSKSRGEIQNKGMSRVRRASLSGDDKRFKASTNTISVLKIDNKWFKLTIKHPLWLGTLQGKANIWSSNEIINIDQLHLLVTFKQIENSSIGHCLALQNNTALIDVGT